VVRALGALRLGRRTSARRDRLGFQARARLVDREVADGRVVRDEERAVLRPAVIAPRE
jgi:hypothetical protein